MKLDLANTLTRLVDTYSKAQWSESTSEGVALHSLKESLRNATAFKTHLLSATALNYIQQAEQAETMHKALTCVTAASSDLLATHVYENTLSEHPVENTSIQYATLATAFRPHYPHLCQQVEALTRTSFDIHDGSIFEGDPEGEYVKLEDVLAILGGK